MRRGSPPRLIAPDNSSPVHLDDGAVFPAFPICDTGARAAVHSQVLTQRFASGSCSPFAAGAKTSASASYNSLSVSCQDAASFVSSAVSAHCDGAPVQANCLAIGARPGRGRRFSGTWLARSVWRRRVMTAVAQIRLGRLGHAIATRGPLPLARAARRAVPSRIGVRYLHGLSWANRTRPPSGLKRPDAWARRWRDDGDPKSQQPGTGCRGLLLARVRLRLGRPAERRGSICEDDAR